MTDYFEYKTIDYRDAAMFTGTLKVQPLEQVLNEHGRIGWELVSAVPNNYYRANRGLVLILRRRR